MRYQFGKPVWTAVPAGGVLAAAMLMAGAPESASAHEGHAALPSTGARVEGDQVLVSERAREGLGLETATVTLDDLSRTLRVRASVELPWDGRAMVTTLVPGRVQAIRVKPGETVAAGQEVARIESLEVETLQLAMLKAAEEIALAERVVQQRRPLAESGAIRGRALLEAETRLRQKRVQLAVAEHKLGAIGLPEDMIERVRATGEPVDSISVTSPIDGVVMHADVRTGQFVDTEQHLLSIVDRSKVLAVGEVLETDAWQVEAGQSVRTTFTALPGESLSGKVERLRLRIRPETRTLGAVVALDNPQGTIRPGISGRMEITVSEASDAIVCPTAALINAPGRTFVLVRRGEGKYQRREVDIGLRTPERVEILAGLFPGDRVIVTGAKLLGAMFPTDDAPAVASTESSRSPQTNSQAPSTEKKREGGIPVAQGIVQLPTSQKTFATPVIEGRIRKIHVGPGETVEAGQVLAELDSQELRSLQLELLETQERLRRVTEILQRVEPLARSGGYPQPQLWEHQMERDSLDHAFRNVQRKLSMIGLSPEQIERLRDTDLARADAAIAFAAAPVRAPAAGRLVDFQMARGQVVHADDALFEIQDLSTVWIEGYVVEQHAARVQVGQTAEIRLPSYPNLRLTGQVIRTAPTLHGAARVLPVWVEVENPERVLREGMFADVQILSGAAAAEVAASARITP